jgi:hypothetical protein
LLKRLTDLGAALLTDHSLGREVYMVFERQEGYFGQPRGGRFPLIIRPLQQLVPKKEISSLLAHIGYDFDGFWDFEDGGGKPTMQSQQAQLALASASAGILHEISIVLCVSCSRPLEAIEVPDKICKQCSMVN